ncbi:MAG TPA: hypothetical protein VIG48_02230 [Jatrophihabitans sp.]
MTHIDRHDGATQLSSLLTQLNADTGVVQSAPSPTEAMAIYSLAVRLAELQLTRTDEAPAPAHDVAMTRDVLLGTRRMLRAALARLEPEANPRFVLIDGGAPA